MENKSRQVALYDLNIINMLLNRMEQVNVRGIEMIQCFADIITILNSPIKIVEEKLEKEPEHVDGEVVK